MQYVFGGVLIAVGAMIVGLAYNNQIGTAWTTLKGKA